MESIKEVNIRNWTHITINDQWSMSMINITSFYSNLLKTDKKSYKDIDSYYIDYINMKDSDYVKLTL